VCWFAVDGDLFCGFSLPVAVVVFADVCICHDFEKLRKFLGGFGINRPTGRLTNPSGFLKSWDLT
jgi:hypothetical protein